MKKIFSVWLLCVFVIALATACDWSLVVPTQRAPGEPNDPNRDRVPIDTTLLDQQCKQVVLDKPQKKPFVFSELKKRFLDAHNSVRRIYGLQDLEWDEDIARYAQEWAEYLKINNQCNMIHRSHAGKTAGKTYGENLAWNWTSARTPKGLYVFTPEKSNYGWSSECAYYNYKNNNCEPGQQCGHFTQLVWRTSKKVGCGVATCDEGDGLFQSSGRSEIWVCNYSPPGNWVGKKPF